MSRADRFVAKRLTLAACILGSGIALLDATAVNVALPTIQRDLGGGLAAQQWIVNGYLLTLGSLILLGGSLGDIFGERRVFALGVGGFGLASLLCAVAPSIGALIAARALQGVAGALLTPSALAVIVATFPERERGPAIGSWTAWGGIAGVIGPLVGGELLALASWRWIFLINLPFVVACELLILVAVPGRRPDAAGTRLDLGGAALAVLTLAGPVFALIEQPRLGWRSPAVLAPLLVGLALGVLFLLQERRSRAPMLPLGLFARRNFAIGNAQTLMMYAGLSAMLFFLTLYLQQVGRYSPLHAGLAMLPVAVVMFLLSRGFGALADRHGPRALMGLGPLVSAAGLALLALAAGVPVDYWTDVLPGLALFSLGLSMTVAPLTAAVLAGVERRQAGIASAVNNAIARTAGLVGTAALGALVAAQFAASLDSRLAGRPLSAAGRSAVVEAKRLTLGAPTPADLAAGERGALLRASDGASVVAFRLGIGAAAALVAAGGAIAAVAIRNPRRVVRARECAGGSLVGAPPDAARSHAVSTS